MLWRVKGYRRYILYLGLVLVSQLLLTVMYGMWFQAESARVWVVTVMIIAGLLLDFSVLYLLQWNLRRLELETRLEEYDKQRQLELDLIKRICERNKGYMDIRKRDTGAELVVIR